MYNKFNNVNKSFSGDLVTLFDMLSNDQKFSFSKYADGEYAILRNSSITVQACDNWTYTADVDIKYGKVLTDSFQYNELGYYVGISCPCCQPLSAINWMRSNVGVSPDFLTWANIFVNGNYKYFLDNFIPFFKKKKKIIIVATEKATKEKLPFNVEDYIPIKQTAWRDNFHLVDELSSVNDSDKLYLFCAGPLGNMLAYKMWLKNKNNTYLDIGSTLNPWLVGKNRDYMNPGLQYYGQKCIW